MLVNAANYKCHRADRSLNVTWCKCVQLLTNCFLLISFLLCLGTCHQVSMGQGAEKMNLTLSLNHLYTLMTSSVERPEPGNTNPGYPD